MTTVPDTFLRSDAPALPRERIQVILDGDLAQFDPEMCQRLLEEAREKTGDPELAITSLEPGSILWS